MKHTPAPWIVRDSDFGSAVWITTKKRNANDIVEICTVDAGFDEPFESEQQANARLIAAAPELLEALQAAVDCNMVPIISALDGGAAKHSIQAKVADQIRAAIAKATGAE